MKRLGKVSEHQGLNTHRTATERRRSSTLGRSTRAVIDGIRQSLRFI